MKTRPVAAGSSRVKPARPPAGGLTEVDRTSIGAAAAAGIQVAARTPSRKGSIQVHNVRQRRRTAREGSSSRKRSGSRWSWDAMDGGSALSMRMVDRTVLAAWVSGKRCLLMPRVIGCGGKCAGSQPAVSPSRTLRGVRRGPLASIQVASADCKSWEQQNGRVPSCVSGHRGGWRAPRRSCGRKSVVGSAWFRHIPPTATDSRRRLPAFGRHVPIATMKRCARAICSVEKIDLENRNGAGKTPILPLFCSPDSLSGRCCLQNTCSARSNERHIGSYRQPPCRKTERPAASKRQPAFHPGDWIRPGRPPSCARWPRTSRCRGSAAARTWSAPPGPRRHRTDPRTAWARSPDAPR